MIIPGFGEISRYFFIILKWFPSFEYKSANLLSFIHLNNKLITSTTLQINKPSFATYFSNWVGSVLF